MQTIFICKLIYDSTLLFIMSSIILSINKKFWDNESKWKHSDLSAAITTITKLLKKNSEEQNILVDNVRNLSIMHLKYFKSIH